MGTAIIALIVLAVIGAFFGLVIGVAGKLFAVETDPRIEKVTEMLPGANCGGCGKAGCADFAKAVCAGEILPGGCPVSGGEAIAAIADFLGIAAGADGKKVAVILCGGDKFHAKPAALYNGVSDCVSANLIGGGPKGCTYGCLGLASCARACPFNAIEVINGLAVVHPEICTGCGNCVETCPRKLIKLTPAATTVHIYCNSPEKAPAKKKVCDVPCIGCRKCAKNAAEGQIEVNGSLARINYADAPGADIVEKAGCPTGCLTTVETHYRQEKAAAEIAS